VRFLVKGLLSDVRSDVCTLRLQLPCQGSTQNTSPHNSPIKGNRISYTQETRDKCEKRTASKSKGLQCIVQGKKFIPILLFGVVHNKRGNPYHEQSICRPKSPLIIPTWELTLLGGSKPGQQQQGPWQLESYNGNLFCLL